MKRRFTVIVCTLWFISVMISCVGVPPREDSNPPLRSSGQQPTSQPMDIDWQYILALSVDEAVCVLQQYANMQQQRMPSLKAIMEMKGGAMPPSQELFERLIQQYVELKRLQGDKDNEDPSKRKIVRLNLSDGNYEGEVKDGKPHGQGTYYNTNGDRYEGEFSDNKYHGQGTYYYTNGDRYVGEFSDGKHHGQGTFYFADGARYVGEFSDNKYHGQGTFYNTNGDRYVGEFSDNKYHGQGTFYYANGDRYVGEFSDGKHHGQGTFYFADGARYVGEFSDDIQNGQGTFYFADGARYVGEFSDVKVAGGWLYKTDGTKTWVTD